MKIIKTHEVDPSKLKVWEREQVYNGLDTCVTYEVFGMLSAQLGNQTANTYAFSRSLQGPVLEMRLRGVLVDAYRKAAVIEEYHDTLDRIESNLEQIVGEGCGFWGFNWRSNEDLKHLFYTVLGIPEIKYQGHVTTNRNALERMESYPSARFIIAHIIALRELGKKISLLKTEVDPDGRMRTSYNIAGTSTGRFSSSLSEFGTGTNMQNIEDSLRSIFIADKGMKMAYLDAEQGESRVVGAIEWNLFKDGAYLDSCESGDLHTTVAKMCWPDLPWTGHLAEDRELAEEKYYRHYSRRFMCKKLGHGSNYGGRANTLAQQTKTEVALVEEFQSVYFNAFPLHLAWHQAVDDQLRSTGTIVSLTGRKRQFWGRRDSPDVLREAIAYDPQGSLADIVNSGMLGVWRGGDCQLLMQNHDAIIIQYPETREDVIIPRVLQQLRSPVELQHGRTLLIPYGCKTGWNWGEWSKDNPDGLKDYRPGDKRKRSKKVSFLDRQFHRVDGKS